MKNSWEWNENDLLELITNNAQESLQLEFKTSPALAKTDQKKKDISIDISAFANSAGGVLVYGMDEDGHQAKALDAGSDPNIITKEWLEQIITSTIHRKIPDLRIRQVALTKTNPGRVAYVLTIPQSTSAPHQAQDKRFYKRGNFKNEIMEEYEIRDVMRRSEIPDLRIEFELTSNKMTFHESKIEPISINAYITNDAFEPAADAIITIFIDARLELILAQNYTRAGMADLEFNGKKTKFSVLNIRWSKLNHMPIFESVKLTLSEAGILARYPNEYINSKIAFLIGYDIRSPKMRPKRIYFPLIQNDLNYILDKKGYSTDELDILFSTFKII